jgi:hypothetical protein
MKKLLIVFTILGCMFITTSYAQAKPAVTVLNSFQSKFTTAKDVKWSQVADLTKADFSMQAQNISAWYNADGEMVATSRYVTFAQLPVTLQAKLSGSFNDYAVTELFEVDDESGTTYYAALATAKKELLLASTSATDWSAYRKPNAFVNF